MEKTKLEIVCIKCGAIKKYVYKTEDGFYRYECPRCGCYGFV